MQMTKYVYAVCRYANNTIQLSVYKHSAGVGAGAGIVRVRPALKFLRLGLART